MGKKRIGVIGCGQWGPNQIRTFFFHPQAEVVRICDTDPARLSSLKTQYSGLDTTDDYRKITRSADIDAVIITTPVVTHHTIAKDALTNGKDVLCEKPLTFSSDEARELIELAEKHKRILMVGHVFLFNSGIRKVKELLDKKECGNTYYFHAKRTNLGPVRKDVNAVHDLASHDISVFNYWTGTKPSVVSAVGMCYLQPNVEDVAFVTLQYPGGVTAHIHVSWLDPKKIRQVTVVGDRKMLTWDDLAPTGTVEIFSKHIEKTPYYKDYGEFQLLAKDGEIVIPSIRNEEPLKKQAEHFMECILERKKPIADGASGLAVVETLEDINRMLRDSRSTPQHDRQALHTLPRAR